MSLRLPPGVYRPGTKYGAKGRWYSANLVRWIEHTLRPVGGWTPLRTSTPSVAPVDVGQPIRGMLAWRANSGLPHLVFGTHAALWHFAGGALLNITPTGFAAGSVNAGMSAGMYGAGAYGTGLYGEGDLSQGVLAEANSWQLDNFGEDLVACAPSDGRIFYRPTATGGLAAPLANAPVNTRAVVVTPEGFIVALAAAGEARRVEWSGQRNATLWDGGSGPGSTAGRFWLEDTGSVMCGRRGRGETLIWTEHSLWAMRFVGGPFIYSFARLGSACGVISRRAAAVIDGRALWMGTRSFFSYEGFVSVLPCDVEEFVFREMNHDQASKVEAVVNGEFGEVTWYYPSVHSVENDRYVTYDFRRKHWTIGVLNRTSGADRGAFPTPILGDPAGRLFLHETGHSYEGAVPFAESGPVELGEGEYVMGVRRIIPDEDTQGGVRMTLIGADAPARPETMHGPFAIAQPTDVRMQAREVRLRVEHVSGHWRFGAPRLDVVQRGKR